MDSLACDSTRLKPPFSAFGSLEAFLFLTAVVLFSFKRSNFELAEKRFSQQPVFISYNDEPFITERARSDAENQKSPFIMIMIIAVKLPGFSAD